MNYANVFGRTQKQFDMTMNREKITEMIANLKALQEMGAISKETIMEKTEYVSDVEVEKKRLSGENVECSPNGEGSKTTDNVDNSVDK